MTNPSGAPEFMDHNSAFQVSAPPQHVCAMLNLVLLSSPVVQSTLCRWRRYFFTRLARQIAHARGRHIRLLESKVRRAPKCETACLCAEFCMLLQSLLAARVALVTLDAPYVASLHHLTLLRRAALCTTAPHPALHCTALHFAAAPPLAGSTLLTLHTPHRTTGTAPHCTAIHRTSTPTCARCAAALSHT